MMGLHWIIFHLLPHSQPVGTGDPELTRFIAISYPKNAFRQFLSTVVIRNAV